MWIGPFCIVELIVRNFTLSIDGNKVSAKAGMAFYSKVVLGIVKYHFEVGAGKENFR
jgi:hypothetical protein